MDAIDETEEATTNSEEIQFIQRQIEAENTRFDNTLGQPPPATTTTTTGYNS